MVSPINWREKKTISRRKKKLSLISYKLKILSKLILKGLDEEFGW